MNSIRWNVGQFVYFVIIKNGTNGAIRFTIHISSSAHPMHSAAVKINRPNPGAYSSALISIRTIQTKKETLIDSSKWKKNKNPCRPVVKQRAIEFGTVETSGITEGVGTNWSLVAAGSWQILAVREQEQLYRRRSRDNDLSRCPRRSFSLSRSRSLFLERYL